VICSQIELDIDGAILLRQDCRASWASFHGSRMADASSSVGDVVTRTLEAAAWKVFRSEIYATYDFKEVAKTARERALKK
jgi:hypothetical protein